jgi:hypothetical protein
MKTPDAVLGELLFSCLLTEEYSQISVVKEL